LESTLQPVTAIFIEGLDFQCFENGDFVGGFILGMFAHYAGIQDNEIGGIHRTGWLHASFFEKAGQFVGLSLVHLAADCPDMIALWFDCHFIILT
jgi:hypothetical protein